MEHSSTAEDGITEEIAKQPRWLVVTIKREAWFARWWLEFRILWHRADGGNRPEPTYISRDWPHDLYGIRNGSAIGKAWHPAHLSLAFRPRRGFRRVITHSALSEEQLADIESHLVDISKILDYDVLTVRAQRNVYLDVDRDYYAD